MLPKKSLTILLIICFVFSSFGFKACEQGNKTAMRRIAEASDDIGNAVNKTRNALKMLENKKLITHEEGNEVRQELINISNISKEHTIIARNHAVFDESAKTDAYKWVQDLQAANLKLIANGSYHVKNAESRSGIASSVIAIGTAIVSISTLIQELKVEPASKPKA